VSAVEIEYDIKASSDTGQPVIAAGVLTEGRRTIVHVTDPDPMRALGLALFDARSRVGAGECFEIHVLIKAMKL